MKSLRKLKKVLALGLLSVLLLPMLPVQARDEGEKLQALEGYSMTLEEMKHHPHVTDYRSLPQVCEVQNLEDGGQLILFNMERKSAEDFFSYILPETAAYSVDHEVEVNGARYRGQLYRRQFVYEKNGVDYFEYSAWLDRH